MSEKLQLPQVTLVVLETRVHELSNLVVLDCLKFADFFDVIIYTDDSQKFHIPGAQYVLVPDWSSKRELLEFACYEMGEKVQSSHLLFVEWDAGIFEPSMWRDDFLQYDYIGAPWAYEDGFNVGNGGFSLRSKALCNFLKAHREQYPIINDNADDTLCRSYRRSIEGGGNFKWAPDNTALDFAFECTRRSRTSQHFGFHALRNWPAVYKGDQLAERVAMAERNDYVRRTGMLNQLADGSSPRYLET